MTIAQIADAYPSLTEESVRGALLACPPKRPATRLRILLDENLPRNSSLHCAQKVTRSNPFTHSGCRVWTTRNFTEFAQASFDLCFTRDSGFANIVRQRSKPTRLKLLRVTLQQNPQDEFVLDFVSAFRVSNWGKLSHGDDWPS